MLKIYECANIKSMHRQLKQRINTSLKRFVKQRVSHYKLSRTCAQLTGPLTEFILRDGKRIRPILFLLSYLGYCHKAPLRLNSRVLKTALSFELLHDFLLIHDDIIDNASLRRGRDSLHKVFEKNMRLNEKTGQDLGIVAGDIIFALALESFISSSHHLENIQEAFSVFLTGMIWTGIGEFNDVCQGFTKLKKINLAEILLNYRLKTSEYTFKSPLLCGCLLADGRRTDLKKIASFGNYLGEAFQILDDLAGLFKNERSIGKSILSDLTEAKKTLPIYLAYKMSPPKIKKYLDNCLGSSKLKIRDLKNIRQIIINCGAYRKTRQRINILVRKAKKKLFATEMNAKYKNLLLRYLADAMEIKSHV
ncbi:MAG: polyprenyl synthetase family protein [Candidatus Omnitrophica bacterium]|nr:polyprenyl synthetase family protein [Candidatus Omnitrophota bacterium]